MSDKYLDEIGLAAVWAKVKALVNTKQDTLVSGTSIKTINGTSLLGSGNITVGGGAVSWDTITGKPSTFPPSSHTHDDRYYTESEVDTKLSGYLPLSGGSLTGNLTGQYITGTWLQATASNHLSSAASKIAVFDSSGWVYHRTPSEILSDIGAAASSHTHSISNITNLSSAFIIEQHAITNQSSLSSGGSTNWTETLSKSGYTPVVAGYHMYNSGTFALTRCRCSGNTLYLGIKNVSQNAAAMSNTSYVTILWIRTGLIG